MNDRTVRLRVVWLSLAALLALAAFNATLHPLVKGFGLAHARWLESEFRPVFVVDSLPRSEVGTILEMYPGEVRGQHGFRVYEILLPTLILAAAMGVLAHFLALHFRTAAIWLWNCRPRLAAPPMALWSGLMLGCLGGVALASDWRFPREAALMPFVLAILGVAAVSLRAWPDAGKISSALTGLSAARWFWLGFLATAYAGDVTAHPAYHTLGGGSSRQLSPGLVAGLVVAFLLFHWFTRAPRKMGRSIVSGDWRGLVDNCDRLTQVSIGELWILLPLVLWTASRFPNQSALWLLMQYLLASTACSAMARWTLEGHPPQARSWPGRLAGTFWRAGTVALIFALPLLVVGQAIYDDFTLPIAVPFVLIGLGLVGGQPWRAQKKACDFAVRTTILPAMESPVVRRPSSWRKRRAALAAVMALGVAVISGAHEDWSARQPQAPSAEQQIQKELSRSFGYRARYLRSGTQSLVVGQDLSFYQQSRAERIVRDVLPNDRISTISVRPWRWEGVGLGILLLTLAGVLMTLPAQLLGLLGTRSLAAPFVVLAGANGAFALGAKWGWFWLDPYVHLAAFAISAVMAGAGVSWARREPSGAKFVPQIPAPPEGGAKAQVAESKPIPLPMIEIAKSDTKAQSVAKLMKVDAISIEMGRGLLALVGSSESARLMERVASIRRQVAMSLGIIVPGIRFRDNLGLERNTYIIRVRDTQVAQGCLRVGGLLAIGAEDKLLSLDGTSTTDPNSGLPGKWISPDSRPQAEELQCMIFDPISVLTIQLTDVLLAHAAELLTLEEVSRLLDHCAVDCPVTVRMARESHSLLTLRDVYRGLVAEGVSIRDHEAILNVLVGLDDSVDALIAAVRLASRAEICRGCSNGENIIEVIGLDAGLEKELHGSLRNGKLPESTWHKIEPGMMRVIDDVMQRGVQPVLLAAPRLRMPLYRSLALAYPSLVVLATNEIAPSFGTSVIATVQSHEAFAH